MNRNKLKAYAPSARRDFIKAVTDRAAFYGLTKEKIEPVTEQGDVAIIGGKPFPRDVAKKRKCLEERIRREGFEQVMEAMAYTWFNRFVAIRYMELHGYLEHGYRVLSTTNHTNDTDAKNRKAGLSEIPDILRYAEHVDLPELNHNKVVELKLAGNRDEELYRMLLIAQCNALHKAIPFLFEWIGDATELLLPENLLHSDSLIRKMVNEIPEEEWKEVEIIGWLYQFYISEKKDQVIGKVVKSEDIPAATQLFTPNWIVKYMVQNTLGRQWVSTYPNSPLKQQMEYYIEPAEQTPEVQEQFKAVTPESLNPEELTLLDPACGSGHILVEAYDLLKAIYQERGYRAKDIPRLILEKNLYGLDIDERAAQLTGFALMMKGRADDRRLLERGVKLNVMALVDSAGFDAEGLAKGVELAGYGLQPADLTELKRLFEHATTFGSLIQVPAELAANLPGLKRLGEATIQDLFVSDALKRLGPLVQQAELLAAHYDAVVANPPYMGSKYQTPILKKYLKDYYAGYEKDFFSAFIVQSLGLSKQNGQIGIVAPYLWMFLSSYEAFREKIVDETTFTTLIQLEYNAFEPACIPVATFTIMRRRIPGMVGSYIRLSDFKGHQNQAPRTLQAISDPNCGWLYNAKSDEFQVVPGAPIAYWITNNARSAFAKHLSLVDLIRPLVGLQTGDNDRFVRLWHEVALSQSFFTAKDRDDALRSGRRWFPLNKGGGFRKWYGLNEHLINWHRDGQAIREFQLHLNSIKKPTSRMGIANNSEFYFRENLTWGLISAASSSFRYTQGGSIFNVSGPSIFPDHNPHFLAGLLNSAVVRYFLQVLSPSISFTPGMLGKIPVVDDAHAKEIVADSVVRAISITHDDWDAYERSWDFQAYPILTASSEPTPTLESGYTAWTTQNRETIAEMKRLEEENNRLFIDAYGLADELTPDVPIEQITLTVNPAYRYDGKLTDEEQWTRFRQDTIEELISFAIGCMMGRYSLDAPGLIYAHSGNEQFWEIYHEKHNKPTPVQNNNHSCNSWSAFPPDQDGIIPITDTNWFPDDAANRFIKFISVAWPREHLEENLRFVAESLSPNRGESPRETIRRYVSTGFFKHHLKMYKKRPIYWLFSSGKLRAFQCLVYLHRYNEGTLSRMRTEYVIPLQGRIAARIEQLSGDISAATFTAHRKKLERERDKLIKQQTELQTFDEKLRHYADQRIILDLDDGVKVNYGKFGDLLAEVQAVTGKKKE